MVIHRIKPERIRGIKIRGFILDFKKNEWFIIDIKPKSRDLREELKELRPRVQKIKNGKDKYFRPKQIFKENIVHLIYLNWESAKGLYKDEENNLPYEVLDINGYSIYRQSTIERKENILNRLEKTAIEEGLKKNN